MAKHGVVMQVQCGRAPRDVMAVRNAELQPVIHELCVDYPIVRGLRPARAQLLAVRAVKILNQNPGQLGLNRPSGRATGIRRGEQPTIPVPGHPWRAIGFYHPVTAELFVILLAVEWKRRRFAQRFVAVDLPKERPRQTFALDDLHREGLPWALFWEI